MCCSFRDESDNSFDGDVVLLMVGVGVIVSYVAIILGKFNEVEHKVISPWRLLMIRLYLGRFNNTTTDIRCSSHETTAILQS